MEAKRTIAEDVLETILSKLTAKQLLQLRCINKLWCTIIGKSSFIQKHYHIHYAMLKENGDIPLLCDKPSVFGQDDPVQFCLLSRKLENIILCLTTDLNRDSSPSFIDNPDSFNTLLCAGVVNGVVLLQWLSKHLGLWNPATREFKAIPHPRPNQPNNVEEHIASFIGLGFESRCNDFKVVRAIDWKVPKDTGWETKYIYEMYSHRANSWKNVEIPCHSLYIRETVSDGYFNGVHYWAANELDDAFDTRQFWMLAFNFSTDVFKLVDPPPHVRGDKPKWEYSVGKYMQFFAAIFTSRNSEDNMCLFDIWVVAKFDDDDPAIPVLWEHILSIGPVPAFDGLWFNSFVSDDHLLLTIQGGEDANNTIGGYACALYNPTTRALKSLGVGLGNCFRYVESLFSISKA